MTKTDALRLVFYADDFTGATDALEVLAAAGLRCALFLHMPDAATLAEFRGLDAIGIAGNSRTMTPQEMQAELGATFAGLSQAHAALVHYKVCSTFDSSAEIGSIGRAVRIARPHFGNRCVPIVAATPALGRHCVFGHLFARSGTDGLTYRLDRHPIMSAHPVTPMTESDLAIHLGRQDDLKVDKLTLPDLRRGVQHLRERLAAPGGAEAMLIDGLDAEDLRITGEALDALGSAAEPVLVVGGSGVQHALTQAWLEGDVPMCMPAAAAAAGPALVLSGSASALSATQIERAVQAGFAELPLDGTLLVDDRRWSGYVDRIDAEAASALQRGISVVLHSARGPADPRLAATLERLQADGVPAADARRLGARLLGERLGQLIGRIVRRVDLARVIVSGGDTSSAVARALDIQAVEMAARLAPGAPLCRVLRSHVVPGIEVAFKGGQMGGADFFVEARDGLGR